MLSVLPRPRRDDPSSRGVPAGRRASALRAAQAALLAGVRLPICLLGLVATGIVLLGAGARPSLLAAAALLVVTFAGPVAAPLAGFGRPRLSPVWAAAVGLFWLLLVAGLLEHRCLSGCMAGGAGSAILLGASLLAAPDLAVALLLGAPAALAFAALQLRLPGAAPQWLTLAFPASMLAMVASCHRSTRHRLVAALRERDRHDANDRHLRQIETAAGGLLWASDADGRLTRLAGEAAGGVSLSDVGDLRVCAFPDRARDTDGAVGRLQDAIDHREAFREVIVPIAYAGRTRWLSLSGQPVTDDEGRFVGYEGVGLDVTTARESEQRIAELAFNDPLTGLPNRESFARRTEEVCRAGWQAALICVSLDDFGAINNTLGTGAGDQLLIAFARRLRGAVRGADFVARLGGGEFGVLTVGLESGRIADVAARIGNEAGAPYRLDDYDAEIASAVHLGISLTPADANDAQSLARNASLALARARRDGLDRPRFFEPALLEELQTQRAIASDLRQALARAELSVWYHPVVDLEPLVPVCAEALLRWHHPTRGELPPALFVPMAEASGTILPIGRFVLNEACREAATWGGSVRVAVNVSPAQFRDETLLAAIDAAIAGSGLPPTRLDVEITESVLLDAGRSTIALLRSLRERGIRVSLDDFGTGYSSLRYLRSFPFDKVKIDASFVRDMTTDRDAAAIVRAVVDLSRNLGMRVLAEGVETEAQRDALRGFGCHEGQGYLFSRVLDPAAAHAFMARA